MRGEWLRRPTAGTSVVFVHGILSSGEVCWRHANGSNWPELLKQEPELESLGIYLFSYQTGIFSGSYSLGNVVDALKEHMRLDGLFDSERLIFVCHSMGGIVVRRLLVQQATRLLDTRMEIGLFLVASPSLGASYADWLSPLARLFGNEQADALRFVRGNEWLSDLDKDFTNLKEAGALTIRGKELIEDKFVILKHVLRQQVVEPFTGAKYFGEPFKVPGSDHFSIAKPEDSHSIQHRLLVYFIKGMLGSPQLNRTRDSAFLVLNILVPEVEALHYSSREANIRFTVTNLSNEAVKIKSISVTVKHKEPVKVFRLPTPGAPFTEFDLKADISEAESVDLLSTTHAQFVLKAGETDAFSLTVVGNEGFRYEADIDCSAEYLARQGVVLISSAFMRLTYPIRTLRGMKRGN